MQVRIRFHHKAPPDMNKIRNFSRANLPSQRQMLEELAAFASDLPVDDYGQGTTSVLEARLADLFGVQACVVMPSGKAAQNIALKLWATRSGSDRIAIHPRSHIEEAEGRAYSEVFGLQSIALGKNQAQPTLDDLVSIKDRLGAASVELALRPLGGTLIAWNELVAMSKHCRDAGVPFHADAARIWEAQDYYAQPFPQIAGLFDSLYVSLYKVIGGFFGGALLGPESLIDEARVWQQRLGQTPYRQFPYILSAMKGLDEKLPQVPLFCRKAAALSQLLDGVDGVFAVTPLPAQINMFQVHIRASVEQLNHGRDQVRSQLGLHLFDWSASTAIDGVSMFEVVAGPATMELSDEDVIEAFNLLLSSAHAYDSRPDKS